MNRKSPRNGFVAIFILLIGVLIGGVVVVGAYYLGTQKISNPGGSKTNIPAVADKFTPTSTSKEDIK